MGYKKVKKQDGSTVIIGTGKGSKGIVTNLGVENASPSKESVKATPNVSNPYTSENVDSFSSLAEKYASMTAEEARNETAYVLIQGANPYVKSSYQRKEFGGMYLSIQKTKNPVDTSYDGTPHKVYLTAFEHQKLAGDNTVVLDREERNLQMKQLEEEIARLKQDNEKLGLDKISKQNKADVKGWIAATLGGGSAGAAATAGSVILAGGLLPMTIPIAAAVFAAIGGFTKVAMRNKANRVSHQIDSQITENKETISRKEKSLQDLMNTITPEEYDAKYS